MKKFILTTACILISFSAWAQTSSGSVVFDLDQNYLNLPEGTSLVIRQFIPISSFDNKIKAEIAIFQNDANSYKTYMLRLIGSYYNSKYDEGDIIKTMNENEIESAIKALAYMIDKNQQITTQIPYTEFNFKTKDSDISFGFYISDTSRKVFFEIGDKFSGFYTVDKLQNIKSFFESVQQKIASLK